MDAIASRYAESLFSLALEENDILAYQKDMALITEVFQSDAKLVQFFSHVAISDDAKMRLLEKSFKEQINQYVMNFLKLLVKKRRFKYILAITHEFELLCYAHFNIKVGTIWTAYELEENEVIKIEKAMSQKLNQKVQLKQIVDPSLIGGVKVEIENHVYDDSISSKLDALRSNLLGSR